MRFSTLLVLSCLVSFAVATHSYNAWANKYYTEKKASQGKLRDYYYKLWQGAKKKAESHTASYTASMKTYNAHKKTSDADNASAAKHLKAANGHKKQAGVQNALATKYKGLYDAAVKGSATNKKLYEKYLGEAKKHAAAAASNLAKSKAASATATKESANAKAQSAKAATLAKEGASKAAQAKAEAAKAAASKKQADANKALADKYYKLYLEHKKKRDFAYTALHHNGKAYEAWKNQGVYLAHATFNKMMYQYTQEKKYLTAQQSYEKKYKEALATYNKHWSAHQTAKKKVKPEALFEVEGYPDLGAVDAETDAAAMAVEDEPEQEDSVEVEDDAPVDENVEPAPQDDSVDFDQLIGENLDEMDATEF